MRYTPLLPRSHTRILFACLMFVCEARRLHARSHGPKKSRARVRGCRAGLSPMTNYFWFIAGALAGICAVVVTLPLMRTAAESMKFRKVQGALGAAGILVFAATAFFVYRLLGSPES